MDEYDRRHFIRTSLPGFLGLTMALPGLTALATRANACQGRLSEKQEINWDAFLEAVAKEAARQHLDDWDEAAYVSKAAKLCSRLNLKDGHLLEAFKKAHRGLGNKRVDFEPLEKQRDFHVTLLQFEKDEEISHHDHPEMTGVILCASGEIEAWNYDLLGEKPDQKHVLLKETNHELLRKSSVSSLTSRERNIHRLKAKELTQLVDIFAPPYNRDRIQKSSWYEVDPDPFTGKGEAKIHLAKKRQ
jgi:cysteamine dioxygenase